MKDNDMKSKKIGILMIALGVFALLAAGGLWLSNYLEELTAEQYAQSVSETLIELIVLEAPPIREAPSGGTVSVGIPPEEEVVLDEPIRYLVVGQAAYIGVLNIPSINLQVPINAGWSYPALRQTPCRYSGSIDGNTLVVAGHNYRSHFLNISNLAMGTPVNIEDVDGYLHEYEVVSIITVEPNRGYEVRHSDYDLTLFTCTSDGQARTVVRCMRIASAEDSSGIIEDSGDDQ